MQKIGLFFAVQLKGAQTSAIAPNGGYVRAIIKRTPAPSAMGNDNLSACLCAVRRTENVPSYRRASVIWMHAAVGRARGVADRLRQPGERVEARGAGGDQDAIQGGAAVERGVVALGGRRRWLRRDRLAAPAGCRGCGGCCWRPRRARRRLRMDRATARGAACVRAGV